MLSIRIKLNNNTKNNYNNMKIICPTCGKIITCRFALPLLICTNCMIVHTDYRKIPKSIKERLRFYRRSIQ